MRFGTTSLTFSSSSFSPPVLSSSLPRLFPLLFILCRGVFLSVCWVSFLYLWLPVSLPLWFTLSLAVCLCVRSPLSLFTDSLPVCLFLFVSPFLFFLLPFLCYEAFPSLGLEVIIMILNFFSFLLLNLKKAGRLYYAE